MKIPRKLLALLCAMLCLLVACGKAAEEPETQPQENTVYESESVLWEAEEDPVEEPMGPSYAFTDTHFYAVGDGGRENGASHMLYYAALNDLERVKRVPLPIHCEGDWLQDKRIDRIDAQWIYLTAKTRGGFYIQLRTALDMFHSEFLGKSDTLSEVERPAKEPPVELNAFCNRYDSYAHKYREILPRPDYEFTEYYAKTPTHIFAVRGGKPFQRGNELYRMPLTDISQQEKIPLPGKFDEIAICGLTEKWLFVSVGQTVYDESSGSPQVKSTITYKLPLDSYKTEKIDEYKIDWYPRYNAASNSLLYLQEKTVEALHLNTSKRSTVFDFSDYYCSANDSVIRGWFNAPDGTVVLDIIAHWWAGTQNCIAIGKDNAVQVMDVCDIPWYTQLKGPQNEAEEQLEKRGYDSDRDTYVNTYITCGAYVYYVENVKNTNRTRNLYRVKPDGTAKELLRAGTHIFSLVAVKDKLCCLAFAPYTAEDGTVHESDDIGFYSLHEDGKLNKVIDTGWLGEWADYGWERFGDLIMFGIHSWGSSENAMSCIYDPATSATFYAYEKETTP